MVVASKVIIMGGGVGGLSAAHELARRGGFDVVVYEQRAVAGGKARSMDAIPGVDGRRALPGEHGFRFIPGFYRHLPDTMTHIPYAGQRHGVLDNLVASTQIEIARQGDKNALIAPAHFPVTLNDWEATLSFALDYTTGLGIPVDDQAHFIALLAELLSACKDRKFGEYENESWWAFSGADQRSAAFQKFFADGLTRSLVAARGREMSARTGGYILLQLLKDLATPGVHVDRVLNGPTSEVWIEPWVSELKRLGVTVKFLHRVEAIESRHDRVTGVSGHVLDDAGNPSASFEDTADYYVAALPVEVVRQEIAMDELKDTCPVLAGLDALTVRWMNGIMFYLHEDVPLVHGHTIYIDSPWALTSISQRQFWSRTNLRLMGDGTVGGILSVDISDWKTPGAHAAKGKIAMDCSKEEVADEVWAQLKAALNNGTETLRDDNRAAWFLDPDIVPPNPTQATNLEPLLVNTAGSWTHRPTPALPEVENLFLASDYLQTYTDLATMEGANEAARRAVNAILDASGSNAERCGVWQLQQPGGLAFDVARQVDAVGYKLLGQRVRPLPVVGLKNGDLVLNPLARLTRATIGSLWPL
jgi:uncharacterized protein with NAD-binding domain and iron-sulfur cluster